MYANFGGDGSVRRLPQPLSVGLAQGQPEIAVEGHLLAGPQHSSPLDILQQQEPVA
jgi:hypothetical protein